MVGNGEHLLEVLVGGERVGQGDVGRPALEVPVVNAADVLNRSVQGVGRVLVDQNDQGRLVRLCRGMASAGQA